MRNPVNSDQELEPRFADIPDPVADEQPLPPPSRPHLPASPSRQEATRARILALCLAAAWGLGHLWIYGVRSDLFELPLPYMVAELLLPALLAVASLFVAVTPGRSGLGAKLSVVLVLAVLGPLIFGAAALGAPLPRPLLPGESSPLDILVCLDITLALTAVPMLCAAFALRRAFAATARWRSALVGAGCGLFAGTLINVHCPNVSPFHLTLGHAVPVLLATVLGAVLMTRWLRA